ncbi:MAG: sulfurtransferase complex subunit TusB [Burkholderiales bacterium]|nr:sulfurtransferase complex subunit TusB [Burkholderiales bacterium]
MLHIINKSPFQTSTLTSCLRMAQAGHTVLLIEDGIYAATAGSSTEGQVREASSRLKFYALKPDTEARGMTAKLIDGVTLVDYGGFVDLVAGYSTSHSWL